MTNYEDFWAIATRLQADRRWARRILWIRVTTPLVVLGMRAVSTMAPAVIMWVI